METLCKALCPLVLKLFHMLHFWTGCYWNPFSWYWLGREEASKVDYLWLTSLWCCESCLRWISGTVLLEFFSLFFFLWQNLGYKCFQAWQRNWRASFSFWLLNLSSCGHVWVLCSKTQNFFVFVLFWWLENKVLVLPIFLKNN